MIHSLPDIHHKYIYVQCLLRTAETLFISCFFGLRLDDDAVRVAVGLRLGARLCEQANMCPFGVKVDPEGTHGLACR